MAILHKLPYSSAEMNHNQHLSGINLNLGSWCTADFLNFNEFRYLDSFNYRTWTAAGRIHYFPVNFPQKVSKKAESETRRRSGRLKRKIICFQSTKISRYFLNVSRRWSWRMKYLLEIFVSFQSNSQKLHQVPALSNRWRWELSITKSREIWIFCGVSKYYRMVLTFGHFVAYDSLNQ